MCDDDAYDGRIRVSMRVGVRDDEDIIYRGGSAPHSCIHAFASESRIERDGFVLAGRDGTGRAGRAGRMGCWIRMMTMEMMMTDEMFDVKRSI